MRLSARPSPAVLTPLAHVVAAPAFFECLAAVVAACARRRACTEAWLAALREERGDTPGVRAAWADLTEARLDADRCWWRALTSAFLVLSRLAQAPRGRA